jgi:hypothetical protein
LLSDRHGHSQVAGHTSPPPRHGPDGRWDRVPRRVRPFMAANAPGRYVITPLRSRASLTSGIAPGCVITSLPLPPCVITTS